MVFSNALHDEISEIAKTIRNAFSIDSELEVSEVKEVHQRFVECIETVNGRLIKCDDLLRKGLRDEAIQECETRPNLLELVNELDIEEGKAWGSYISQFGTAPQPDILIDVAIAINEAYVDRQPLEGLLRQHRALAISRSPLSQRLNVLRNILLKDPSNPAWQEDVSSYEATRLNQIANLLKSKPITQDLAAVTKLRNELVSNDWVNKPAKALVQACNDFYVRLVRDWAINKLKQLIQPINSAFSDFDITKARAAKKQWDYQVAAANLKNIDPIQREVAAAFQWLAQEEFAEQQKNRFEAALRTLENAIENHGSARNKLEREYRVVEDFDEPIPEKIARRFNDRIESFRVEESRKRTLTIAGAVTVLLLAVGAAGWFTNNQMYQSRLASSSTALSALVENGNLDQAKEMLENLQVNEASIFGEPEIQALRMKREELSQVETGRRRLFEDSLGNSRSILSQRQNWEGLELAQKDLEDAQQHSDQSVNEQTSLKEVERDLRLLRTELQEVVNKETNLKLGQLADQLVDINSMGSDKLAVLARQLEAIAANGRITPESLRQVNLLRKKIADESSLISMRQREKQDFARIKESVGKKTSFRNAITDYTKVVTKGQLADDLRETLSGLDELTANVDRWNKFAQKWNTTNFAEVDADAESLTTMVASIVTMFQGFPGLSETVAGTDYLEDMSARRKTGGEFSVVNDLLDSPSFSDFMLIETKDQESYFVVLEPEVNSRQIIFYPIDSVNIKFAPKAKRIDLDKIIKPQAADKYYDDAPQKTWCENARKFLPLGDSTFKDWEYERRMAVILGTLQANDMEPLLKLKAMKILLDDCCPKSSILNEEFQPAREQLATIVQQVEGVEPSKNVGDFDWLSKDEDNRRRVTQRLLASWIANHDFSSIAKEKIIPRLEKILKEKPTIPSLDWAGCMFSENGNWIFEPAANADTDQLCVLREANTGIYTLQRIKLGAANQVKPEGGTGFTQAQLVFSISE